MGQAADAVMHIYICRSTNKQHVSIIHNTIHPSQRKVKGKVGRWGRRGRRGISDLDKYCGEYV